MEKYPSVSLNRLNIINRLRNSIKNNFLPEFLFSISSNANPKALMSVENGLYIFLQIFSSQAQNMKDFNVTTKGNVCFSIQHKRAKYGFIRLTLISNKCVAICWMTKAPRCASLWFKALPLYTSPGSIMLNLTIKALLFNKC